MAVIQRCLRVVLWLFMAVMLQGCPKQMVVSFLNNSGVDLVIRLTDGFEPWPHGVVWSTQGRIDRMRWVQDERTGGTVPVLDVVKGVEVRSYQLSVFPLPNEYLSNGGKSVAHLQLESDGFLYAVKAVQLQSAPVTQPQPSRFPLKPLG